MKNWIEIALAVVSFVSDFLIYFVLIPNGCISSSIIFRPLICALFTIMIPVFLFGGRNYAEKYGYRQSGLMKSVIIAVVLAPPLFMLGYKIAAGPAPPLVAWYGFIVLEETYFRGLWQRAGTHLAGSMGAVFIPAALFGIYHLPLGFTPIQALGVVLFGLLLGWLRKSTGNLLGPILLHSALATGMWFSPL